MKKIVSMLLCVAMLLSALTLFTYAVEDEGSTQSPVIDGVVGVGEYISERVFDNTDAATGTTPAANKHPDFAANCVPAEGESITEYASEDEENIYVAFVISQDISSTDFYMTGRAQAAATMSEHKESATTCFSFDLQESDETEGSVRGAAGIDGNNTDTDGTEMRAYRSGEYESIAKRNKSGDVFENITIEIKISKEAIKDVCKVDSVEFIGYRIIYRPIDAEKVDLCSRAVKVSQSTSGFSKFSELCAYYLGSEENDVHYLNAGYKTLRFICFYEEPAAKAWYGPVGSKSPEGVERATVLDYTDVGRFAATSTYVVSGRKAPPVIDGVVEGEEYSTSKLYATEKFSTKVTGVTLTEYAAYDAEYIYFAIVYNTNMSSIDVRMNGKSTARTDMLQAEYVYHFKAEGLASVDEKSVVGSRGDFDADHVFAESEYEGIAKKNKEGETIVSTTLELKISRSAMRRVFEVDAADFIGYYALGVAVANGNLGSGDATNAAQLNGVTTLGWKANGSTKATEVMAQSYGTTASLYLQYYRLFNFIMFGYEEPEVHNSYASSDGSTPSDPTQKLDLSDLTCLSVLASNYVPSALDNSETPGVFSLEISFGSMSFDYIDNIEGEWNPQTHDYDPIRSWVCDEDDNKITVVNDSNFAILASFIYKKEAEFEGVTGAFDNAVARLVGTAEGASADRSTVDAYLELSGEFGSENAAETEIGQVIVKIIKANS
ncbi:MAG: hypothetical protein E7679_00985 [Ruminococcaceae bacterium]|nr:hypothetical protein [Oscillospiraceae bacterium]